jgi:hypothetical protein
MLVEDNTPLIVRMNNLCFHYDGPFILANSFLCQVPFESLLLKLSALISGTTNIWPFALNREIGRGFRLTQS